WSRNSIALCRAMPEIVEARSQRVATDLNRASLSGGSQATQSSRTLLLLVKRPLTIERDKVPPPESGIIPEDASGFLDAVRIAPLYFRTTPRKDCDWNSSRSISFCNGARKWQISSRRDAIPTLINSTGRTRRKVYPRHTKRNPPMN